MKTFLYPNKDATIYESASSMNTGIDQILDLDHTLNENNLPYNSRILMDFNLTSISQSVSNGTINNPKFYLRLFTVEAYEVPKNYTIEAYPISGSWTMGLGKQKHTPITNEGVSWTFKDGYVVNTGWLTSSYNSGTTGSWATVEGGGNWYTGSSYRATQSFEYETTDVRMDVTNIVSSWLSGSIEQDGLIIKRTDSDEQSQSVQGNTRFFSLETNTIYIPRLEIAWDDTTFITGSQTELAIDDDIQLHPKLKRNYKEGARTKIRLNVRPRYPQRTFTTSSNQLTEYYLPTSSYYQIRDAHTEDVIMDFDEYTKISRDENGNYFNLWMDTFQPERFYSIVFKVVDENNNIEFFDNDYNFKVIKW